jgi:PIN domain nuclease of toxin-antitoxin system
MKLLLDTHVLLALPDRNTTRLGRRVERLLNDEEHDLHASVASLWEMAIKHRLGKLRISPNLDSWPELLAGLRIDVIQITAPTPSADRARAPHERSFRPLASRSM